MKPWKSSHYSTAPVNVLPSLCNRWYCAANVQYLLCASSKLYCALVLRSKFKSVFFGADVSNMEEICPSNIEKKLSAAVDINGTSLPDHIQPSINGGMLPPCNRLLFPSRHWFLYCSVESTRVECHAVASCPTFFKWAGIHLHATGNGTGSAVSNGRGPQCLTTPIGINTGRAEESHNYSEKSVLTSSSATRKRFGP